jgi:ribose-phosphate pyrophosphokinase
MSVPRYTDDKNYYIYNQYGDNTMQPVGPIGLIAHNLSRDFSDAVNYFLRNRRSIYVSHHPELALTPGFMRADYRIPVTTPRFSSGEGKAVINQSVRGHDLFIITDVLNYDSRYTRNGRQVTMSPDDQFQDLIRLILASAGQARRINLIMPYLYEGQQNHRAARESLDCGAMLKYLFQLGVENLITFDAHDGRVINAVPTFSMENLTSSYQLIEALLHNITDLNLDSGRFMVVSPDEGGISKAIYYAGMLEVPLGIFYRQRDYLKNVQGTNPVIGQEFLGEDVHGRDVLLVDDMIVTGDTMLRVAHDLVNRGAKRIFCAVTYAQFTAGLAKFDEAHRNGVIDRVFATNLTYRRPELLDAPWFVDVNMTRFVALLIDAINHDASLSKLISPTEKIQKLLDYYRRHRD